MQQGRGKVVIGALLTVGLLSACNGVQSTAGERTVTGSGAQMHGATVHTWARVDAQNKVNAVGFTLPLAAVTAAPTSGHPHVTRLDFPKVVQDTTFFDHVSLDFMPEGHEPEGRYTTPHFDFHFFGVSKAEVQAIDCTDGAQPDPASVPHGWVPPVPPNATPQAFCVPQMGYHALHASEFKAPGVLQDGLFDKVMIAGYYQGQFQFVEPMITKALLEQKASFTLPVPQPASVGRPTRFPAKFEALYDAKAQAYTFVFSDFKTLQ